MKLTPANARAAQPGDRLRCSIVTGLELRCGATKKSWRFYYRTKSGRERRPTLGHWPALSIEAARDAARQILASVAAGGDPAAHWQADRDAPTVSDLLDRYLTHLLPRRAAGTLGLYQKIKASHLDPSRLSRMRVADVRLEDVELWLQDVQSGRYTGRQRPAPTLAHAARAMLSGAFTYAETRLRWRPQHTNPCRGTELETLRSRERYATEAELARIGAALRRYEPSHPHQVALLYVLLYTGARPMELAQVRLEHWQEGHLVVERHKSQRRMGGAKRLYLPEPARAILGRLAPHPSGLVFGGRSVDHLWRRLRVEADCPDLQLRDLRRTFASLGYNGGVDERVISQLLFHSSLATTKVYTRLFDTQRQAAAETMAQAAADALQPSTGGQHNSEADTGHSED